MNTRHGVEGAHGRLRVRGLLVTFFFVVVVGRHTVQQEQVFAYLIMAPRVAFVIIETQPKPTAFFLLGMAEALDRPTLHGGRGCRGLGRLLGGRAWRRRG